MKQKLSKKMNEIKRYCSSTKSLERKIGDDENCNDAILSLKEGEDYYFLYCFIKRKKSADFPTSIMGYGMTYKSWGSAKKDFKKIKSVSDFKQLYNNLRRKP